MAKPDAAQPTAVMRLVIVLGREPMEGTLALEPGSASERWPFVGLVEFVRALEEAIGAAKRRLDAAAGNTISPERPPAGPMGDHRWPS